MKKKFFLIWIFLFAVLIAFDVLVYRGAEELECIEPSIGTTAVINIALSMISAACFFWLIVLFGLISYIPGMGYWSVWQ